MLDSSKIHQVCLINSEIDGKAPNGFGLGTHTPTVVTYEDVDTLIKNGWYTVSSGSNMPSGSDPSGAIFVNASSSERIWQTFYQKNSNYSARRFLHAGVWQLWEWINPPLASGLIYRTVERWEGAPVYARLISVGSVTATGEKFISFFLKQSHFGRGYSRGSLSNYQVLHRFGKKPRCQHAKIRRIYCHQ